jgi:hypothetical protein
MALALHSRDLSVTDGGTLFGRLKNNDGHWNIHRFDLNGKLGNNHGSFQVGGMNFTWSAERGGTKMDGTILRARLGKGGRDYVDASINLADILEVVDGKFAYKSQCVYYLLLHAVGLLNGFQLPICIQARRNERSRCVIVFVAAEKN